MFKEVGKIFRKKNPQDYMDPTKSSLPNIPIATRLEKKKKGTSKIQRPQVR
jgi:hypothetical protein